MGNGHLERIFVSFYFCASLALGKDCADKDAVPLLYLNIARCSCNWFSSQLRCPRSLVPDLGDTPLLLLSVLEVYGTRSRTMICCVKEQAYTADRKTTDIQRLLLVCVISCRETRSYTVCLVEELLEGERQRKSTEIERHRQTDRKKETEIESERDRNGGYKNVLP